MTQDVDSTVRQTEAETESFLQRLRNDERRSTRFLLRVLTPIAILLVIWQLVAYVASRHLQSPIGLLDIVEAFAKLVSEGDTEGRTMVEHTGLSMFRVALGFLAAILTGVPLGIAIGRYRIVNSILGPVVEAIRPIPPIAWIPISILMYQGNFLGSQVFIIWIGAFFPILLNTTAGVKRTDTVHLDVARTFGASEIQVLQKIVVPSAAPEVFAGLRIGFGIGWMCLVAAEMIGGGIGLGHLVIVTEQLGRTAETISAMLVIGLIGFLISYMFLYIEKQLLRWRKEVSI
ncbi:MAG: ABC transporter permease [Candidatus Thorarchaeota archaeon]|nr:MAG: ABC transporter permease [Candidatus Thorarchaeota archaeon]